MLHAILKFVTVLTFIFACQLDAANKEVIKFAAIDWCPQLCGEQKDQGYIIELIKKIYPASEYQLEIDFFPWSRAIKVVRSGQYHALLSPAKYEAPGLRYPVNPAGFQQMCFFVLRENNWRYTGVQSLASLRIGIAADTSIEELNQYFLENEAQFQVQPYLERYVAQHVNKLLKHRVDTFIFTRNTTVLELSKLNLDDKITIAGCVKSEMVFVAFSSHPDVEKQISNYLAIYDAEYPSLVDSGWIQSLYNKYNISWDVSRHDK